MPSLAYNPSTEVLESFFDLVIVGCGDNEVGRIECLSRLGKYSLFETSARHLACRIDKNRHGYSPGDLLDGSGPFSERKERGRV